MDYRKQKINKQKVSYWIFIMFFLLPPLITLIFNWIICSIEGVYMAFTTYDGVFTLNNFTEFFIDLFSGSATEALGNTALFYILGTFIMMPLNYLLSYFIYKRVAGYKIFRIILFLPSIIPAVAMTLSFKEFIKPWGPLGNIVELLGGTIPREGLLQTQGVAIWMVVAYQFIFGLPGSFMIQVGTMSRIPDSCLEAAKLDGCSTFREFRSIILPLMMPLILLGLLTGITGFFGATGPLLLLTNGEAGTMTVSYWIEKRILFSGVSAYNLTAAASLSLGLLILPISLVVRKLMVKLPPVEF